MGTCYICGKTHANYRRTVFTGNSRRTGYSSMGSVNSSVTNHYGVRTVCAICALSIDYKERRNSGIWGIYVGTLIAVSSIAAFAFEEKTIGIVLIISGILLSVITTSISHSKADEWLSENRSSYIDDVIELKKTTTKKNNEKDGYQLYKETCDSFSNMYSNEINTLQTIETIFYEKYKQHNVILNTNEDCKIILIELNELEKKLKVIEKEIIILCDDFVALCNKYFVPILGEELESFLHKVDLSKIESLNHINNFLFNEIKEIERQVLTAQLRLT